MLENESLDLDPAKLQSFAEQFNETLSTLWRNIEGLATSLWDGYEDLGSQTYAWPPKLRLIWHHLLLAVANFKRQRWVNPQVEFERTSQTVRRRDELTITLLDGSSVTVRRDAQDHEIRLKPFRGFRRAPTGSALLAALWPEHHANIDWRVYAATLVLSKEGWERLQRAHPSALAEENRVEPEWSDYDWYLSVLQSTGKELGFPIQVVERGLFMADGEIAPNQRRTWREYHESVRELLRKR